MAGEKKPLVTIGIPTYNRADGYLKDALESALGQSYENIEVVVSDNASTDRTEAFVKSYDDARIKYYKHDQNIGANGNFNYCLEQANGKYFLMLHDDDLLDLDFVDCCMQAVSEHGKVVGVIRTGVRVKHERTDHIEYYPNRFKKLSPLEIFRIYCNSAYLTFCNALFRTEALQELGGFKTPRNLSVDAAANLFMTVQYGSIEIEDIKATFRVHDTNFSHSTEMENWVEDHYYLVEKMCSHYPQKADELRHYAYKYMSMKDYLHTKGTLSGFERYRAYWMIYKKYDFRFSPFSWFLKKRVRPRTKYSYFKEKLFQAGSTVQR